MTHPVPATVLAILLASGAGFGAYTHRWHAAPEFGDVQRAFDGVPESVGPWRGRPNPFEADDLRRAGIQASLSRVYRNPQTGKQVTVLLVAGKPGPIAVHTPDVCFQGLGYDSMSAPEAVSLPGTDAKFWRMECRNPGGVVPKRVYVYWAWNADGTWEAPAQATTRVRYAFRPVLRKLYLIADVGVGKLNDPVPEFAAAALPEFARTDVSRP